MPVRQDEAADGDAPDIGRGRGRDASHGQALISRSRGVLVGDGGTQNNFFFTGRDDGAQRASGAEAGGSAGWLLGELDPFDLEVHRPVQVDGSAEGLPTYLARGHDRALQGLVRAAAGGESGAVVLVGGSSTGKTRACWQALELLRGEMEPWRLWHPISPSRPEAALGELSRVGPRTVVWLNEAQHYFLTGDETGERVAAGLRELLRDPSRAPVLVLATLWPG
ncbi:MAG TPA: hypothetical protein VI365_36345, partial [Trebonia sp.]